MPEHEISHLNSFSDEEFTTRLVERQPTLYKFARARGLNHEDAEDATQEAIFLAYRGRARLKDITAMNSWLSTILLNAVRHQFRDRNKTGAPIYEHEISSDKQTPVESALDPYSLEGQLVARDSLKAIEKTISSARNTAIVFRRGEGYSVSEVGEMYGLNENTIKVICFRERQKIGAIRNASAYER